MIRRVLTLGAVVGLSLAASAAHAAAPTLLPDAAAGGVQTAEVVRISLTLTLLALIPALAICMTPFIRIIITLSMIRHAFGMPETPPAPVLVSLAIFLTIFTMGSTLTAVNDQALQPFLAGSLTVDQAVDRGSAPMKAFMLRQVNDEDLQTVYEIARKPLPETAAEVGLAELTTAFMLHELATGFKIGFVILLPFLLIDLVVSGILLSLGMMMVPPTSISLPIKVLMFVLIDGWSLVLEGVVGGFR
jgi:flagellar biosynthetic protein FliP